MHAYTCSKSTKTFMRVGHACYGQELLFECGHKRESEMKWVGRWSAFVIFSFINERKVEELPVI